MNKKMIIIAVLGLIMAATTYLAYTSLDQLEEFDFSDPFDTEFDEY